jgi:hypothetical protein
VAAALGLQICRECCCCHAANFHHIKLSSQKLGYYYTSQEEGRERENLKMIMLERLSKKIRNTSKERYDFHENL